MLFIDFIIKNRQNKRYLLIVLMGTAVQFIIFKLMYPFADFFSDSYSYIYAAYANLDINIWPIGYSKFLRFFHYITHSDTALVAFQYFLLELSGLYFYFTIMYFYQPRKTNQIILFVFLFFNPLLLYLCNYVNSDPLFAALSILWFTQLLWIIHKPHWLQIFVQGILLFLLFTIRNNAYYYPVLGSAAFILSRQKVFLKLAGIVLPFLFIVPFILYTRHAAKVLTGTAQYSLFTGWQLANNTLYMYGNIKVDTTLLPSPESKELDQITRHYYQQVPPSFQNDLSSYVANFFIRQSEAPLKQYFNNHFKPTDNYAVVVAWGKASVTFAEYGKFLLKNYPMDYVKYFMLRNTRNYFLPPLEKLEIYNLGRDAIAQIAEYWFDYKTGDVTSVSKKAQGNILWFYPYFFMLINLCFIGSLIWLFFGKLYGALSDKAKKTLWLICTFWLINFAFGIFATILVFRYEIFPMIVFLPFSLILVEWLSEKETFSNTQNRSIKEKERNVKVKGFPQL